MSPSEKKSHFSIQFCGFLFAPVSIMWFPLYFQPSCFFHEIWSFFKEHLSCCGKMQKRKKENEKDPHNNSIFISFTLFRTMRDPLYIQYSFYFCHTMCLGIIEKPTGWRSIQKDWKKIHIFLENLKAPFLSNLQSFHSHCTFGNHIFLHHMHSYIIERQKQCSRIR